MRNSSKLALESSQHVHWHGCHSRARAGCRWPSGGLAKAGSGASVPTSCEGSVRGGSMRSSYEGSVRGGSVRGCGAVAPALGGAEVAEAGEGAAESAPAPQSTRQSSLPRTPPVHAPSAFASAPAQQRSDGSGSGGGLPPFRRLLPVKRILPDFWGLEC